MAFALRLFVMGLTRTLCGKARQPSTTNCSFSCPPFCFTSSLSRSWSCFLCLLTNRLPPWPTSRDYPQSCSNVVPWCCCFVITATFFLLWPMFSHCWFPRCFVPFKTLLQLFFLYAFSFLESIHFIAKVHPNIEAVLQFDFRSFVHFSLAFEFLCLCQQILSLGETGKKGKGKREKGKRKKKKVDKGKREQGKMEKGKREKEEHVKGSEKAKGNGKMEKGTAKGQRGKWGKGRRTKWQKKKKNGVHEGSTVKYDQ